MSEIEQQAASHPPAFVSTIVKTLLRSPLHGMMSKNMLLLSFKGTNLFANRCMLRSAVPCDLLMGLV